MKIIKNSGLIPEMKEDGRKISSLLSYSFPNNRKVKLFLVTIPSGTHEKEHMHTDSEEIFFFLSSGKIIVNGETYNLEPKDIIIIEKKDKHKIIADQPIEMLGIKEEINDKVLI